MFGIGGSGDVVGAIPTARLLEDHGVETTLGGVAWKPAPEDPTVGPRSFDEIERLEPVSDTVGLASAETHTADGVAFGETGVAAHDDEAVALIDISRGLDAMIDGIEDAFVAAGIPTEFGRERERRGGENR